MSATSLPALISAEDLAARLGDPRLVVIDIRPAADGGREAFEAGHVPGAVHSDYGTAGWRVRSGNAGGLLPALGPLAELVGSLGIVPDSDVVIVSAGRNANDIAGAARVYWTLKVIGHGQQAILDGGYTGWVADPARPVETGAASPKGPAAPYPVVVKQGLRSTADATLVAAKSRLASLVDARAASYFEGREKAADAARAGRIPGAISRDHAEAVDPATGRLKDAATLAALYAQIPEGPAISYCNTGHSAALNWFVLSELLGRDEVSLYDGSMTDWTQDPDRPVATGTA